MPKILIGKVASLKMPKTVVVEVERKQPHPVYKKLVKKTKKYKAHNENLVVRIGDKVKVKEIRPFSKDKHFELVGVIEKGVRKSEA